MNEYGVLMRLLTRTGEPMGASVDDLLDALALPEDAGRHIIYKKLAGLHKLLQPLGLSICHNPVHHVYFVDTTVTEPLASDESPLPDRLAATLLVVLTLAYEEGGWVHYDRIKEFRKKGMQSVTSDLRQLADMGYVELDKAEKKVRPGIRVPFEIDHEAFFGRLSESDTD